MANTVEVDLKRPIWDENKKLYRPGRVTMPRSLAEQHGLVQGSGGVADGTLPDGFPGYKVLTEGGFTTIDAVRGASDEDLLALDGIGASTLEKIREAQA